METGTKVIEMELGNEELNSAVVPGVGEIFIEGTGAVITKEPE